MNRLNPDQKFDRGRVLAIAVCLGTIFFWLPFLSKQFMGDDWLWLFNAKRATADLEVFLERPMYGYFRPLNLAIVWIWYHLFGPNPVLFSLVSILLHAANVWLLWRTLRRFGAADEIAIGASFLFAFYYLNCSAIEWISVGHDLWVTALSLLVAMKSADFADDGRPRHFIALALLGAAATLTKESGFVTLGIYFIVLILRGRSPFGKTYIGFTMLLTAGYLGFLIPYFLTRTVIDKEVHLGADSLINLIYFLVYLALPFSKRVVALVPAGLGWMLGTLRVVGTIALPFVAYYGWKRGGTAVRLFLTWPVMFLSTIAILEWNLGLFDLYPETTAARFMYSPIIGFAVVIA